jgi:uncharacterized protein YjbI with pentapeptide repeats
MANPEHLRILREGVEAWNKWRTEHSSIKPDLVEADLSGVNLSKANLIEADLSGADLSEVNLCEANLHKANFCRANLRETCLSKANLGEANLRRADLSGAFVIEADLRRADLSGADLSDVFFLGANLSEAEFGYTLLARTDLSEVIGLHSVIHNGPSSIGIDTFFQSKGKIPAVFLRGAGVPDVFLQCAASLAGTPFEYCSCFISYSHADKLFARRLHDALQARGIRCWLDEKQLLPGDDIHLEVDEAVRLWDKVLLCCSETSLASWWVDKEVRKALEKEKQLWNERRKQVLAIIPLNLDGYMFDTRWQDWKKQHLTSRLAADFTGWEKDNVKFEEQFEGVVKALRADAGARVPPPKPRL